MRHIILPPLFSSLEEAELAIKLCAGRIWGMSQRPAMEGDIQEYMEYRDLAMDAQDYIDNEDNFKPFNRDGTPSADFFLYVQGYRPC